LGHGSALSEAIKERPVGGRSGPVRKSAGGNTDLPLRKRVEKQGQKGKEEGKEVVALQKIVRLID